MALSGICTCLPDLRLSTSLLDLCSSETDLVCLCQTLLRLYQALLHICQILVRLCRTLVCSTNTFDKIDPLIILSYTRPPLYNLAKHTWLVYFKPLNLSCLTGLRQNIKKKLKLIFLIKCKGC